MLLKKIINFKAKKNLTKQLFCTGCLLEFCLLDSLKVPDLGKT